MATKFWIASLVLFATLGVFIFITWLVEPSSSVSNILISNISDHQVTISWTTEVPTRGTLIVSENPSFPLLPMFSNNLHKDDGERNTSKLGYYTTHHITIRSLSASKKYNFRIYQGQKKAFEGSFVTGPPLQSFSTPNPVYGKVVREDKQTPVTRAIIYLKVEAKEATPSSLLSTLTNLEGGWSLDLANLRDSTLNRQHNFSKQDKEQIIVEAGDLGRVKAATSSGKDKPWPTIIIK